MEVYFIGSINFFKRRQSVDEVVMLNEVLRVAKKYKREC